MWTPRPRDAGRTGEAGPACRDRPGRRPASALRRSIRTWRAGERLPVLGYVWIVVLLGGLAALTRASLGEYLVPPFAATLTILLLLADAGVAQPYPVILGSVLGAGIGTLTSLVARGPAAAVVAAFVALMVVTALRVYHPPGVALALYPVLLHPGPLFAVTVVLPFTVVAVGSAAVLSRLSGGWPAYPAPLPER